MKLPKKNSNLNFFHKTQHVAHHLKLVDKMCIYEMDPASIVEDTEQIWFCPQMDRWTNGGMDRWTRRKQYTPFNLVEWGYNKNTSILRIPQPPHDNPYYWFIVNPKSKHKVKSKLQI